MRTWQIKEAKARLSHLIKEAMVKGPQEISVRGEPRAIIISKAEYNKLIKPKLSLVHFMQQSPLAEVEISMERDSTSTREIQV